MLNFVEGLMVTFSSEIMCLEKKILLEPFIFSPGRKTCSPAFWWEEKYKWAAESRNWHLQHDPTWTFLTTQEIFKVRNSAFSCPHAQTLTEETGKMSSSGTEVCRSVPWLLWYLYLKYASLSIDIFLQYEI